jgi:hypothetical protein
MCFLNANLGESEKYTQKSDFFSKVCVKGGKRRQKSTKLVTKIVPPESGIAQRFPPPISPSPPFDKIAPVVDVATVIFPP